MDDGIDTEGSCSGLQSPFRTKSCQATGRTEDVLTQPLRPGLIIAGGKSWKYIMVES